MGTAEGTLHLLKNTGTAERPRFQAAQPLTTAAGSILAVESHAAPLVYDYNGNGLLDLLVGDGAGRITLFLNTGSAGQPRFAPAGFLQAGGKVLKTAGAAAPLIVDWDGDGQPDLLVGESSGKVIFFPGSPLNGKLNFKAGQPLRHAAGEVQVNSFAAPLAVDRNNGRLICCRQQKGRSIFTTPGDRRTVDTGSITRSPNFSAAARSNWDITPSPCPGLEQ